MKIHFKLSYISELKIIPSNINIYNILSVTEKQCFFNFIKGLQYEGFFIKMNEAYYKNKNSNCFIGI